MKEKKIILVAGGSGGHILPALQLGKLWKKNNKNRQVIFIGQKGLLDQKILENKDFLHTTKCLRLGKFSLKKFWTLPILFWQLLIIFIKSFFLFQKHAPTNIISTGGLLAVPVSLAGWLQKIPVELHELNVIPGKAVHFLARFANKIFIVFEKTTSYFSESNRRKCIMRNYPVRFTKKQTIGNRENLIRYINQLVPEGLDFSPSRKTLFILGGSQGSLLLNTLVKEFVVAHPSIKKSIQIIHQTGNIGKTNWESFYASHNIPAFTFSFYKNIEHCYLLADLVLCRAGAGTLFELLFFEKKSLVIPLIARSTDHQIENARAMEKLLPGLFSVVEQKDIAHNKNLLFDKLSGELQKTVSCIKQIQV